MRISRLKRWDLFPKLPPFNYCSSYEDPFLQIPYMKEIEWVKKLVTQQGSRVDPAFADRPDRL